MSTWQSLLLKNLAGVWAVMLVVLPLRTIHDAPQGHHMYTWCHPQYRKYTPYHNTTGGGLSHSHRLSSSSLGVAGSSAVYSTCTHPQPALKPIMAIGNVHKKLSQVWLCNFHVMRADRTAKPYAKVVGENARYLKSQNMTVSRSCWRRSRWP